MCVELHHLKEGRRKEGKKERKKERRKGRSEYFLMK
jgi:hypothetical protein